jgi:DNA (cytosine-5)-methyltransferase 1
MQKDLFNTDTINSMPETRSARILNLYAGLGGNRLLWDNVEVTAVEKDPATAAAYKAKFPNDKIHVTDAHEFLRKHYHQYDFIWCSPPCQSHGQLRFNLGHTAKGAAAVFPDLKLYEEIIFLRHYFKGKWVIENVKPYYEPLIKPTAILGRHCFWSNFEIPNFEVSAKGIRTKNKISDYKDLGFQISHTGISNKRQALRNCVDSELSLKILDCSNVRWDFFNKTNGT